ncbi:type II CRISPR RNA-guided endonuclease Cas9 [Flavicella sp.]|uniref:type II CRISPR RNA-guided endonuclease Cas9 n=1 Tax=Flavicella sp. TaxID=2957742 RepID=UPI003019BBE1
MTKTLGLDLGTNSIGWALIEDKKLDDKGVLIFSEGVKKENGIEKSKTAERTAFRSSRRLKFRRKIRKYQTLLVLAKYNLCPLTVEEVEEWRKSNFKNYPTKPEFLNWLKTDEALNINPYYFRDKASKVKINNYDLGRAFYHIAQRRGFLSNRLDQSDKGVIEKIQPELSAKINEAENLIQVHSSVNEYYEQFDIIDKKTKDLNAGENELKKLYNSFLKIYKEKISTKEVKQKLLERLYKKENLGAVKKGISDLDEAILNSKCKTLGQYFWRIYNEDRNNVDNKIRNKYTSREDHYLKEFEIICTAQNLAGIDYSKKDANQRYNGFVKELYKAIFYQRPLKSQKGLVGKCSLEASRTRCASSRPEFEEFRMYSFINNIKIKTSDNENYRLLNSEERTKIINSFYRKSKPTFAFEDLKKILGVNHLYNYKDKSTISGCPTIANLINVFGKEYKNIIFENYTDKNITDRKTNKTTRFKTPNEVIADIWHVLSTYTSDEKLKDFALEKLKTDTKTAEKFAKIHLKKEYASLSLYAINKILPYLKIGLLYPHAVFMANMDKIVSPEKWNNKDDRALIEKEIGHIITNHQEENKIFFVINSLLSNCYDRDNNFNYSKEAENIFKEDLEKSLKKEFGIKNWESKKNKEALFSTAFNTFISHLKVRDRIISKRVDEKIMAFLSDNQLIKPNLTDHLYHPSDIDKFSSIIIKDKNNTEFIGLGSPEVGSIKNPMAMKALHQLKKLINTLIIEEKIDKNTKINIELSRQLNDANKRKAIEKWQNDKKELYKIYADKIKELYPKENNGQTIDNLSDADIEKFAYLLEQREDGKIVSKEDILKYTLWEEQNHVCIYTGKTISLSDFLGGNPKYDIEHTLPRSRSWDNSQLNKTLCESKFNRSIKGNKTPFELQINERILPRIKHWKVRYENLSNEIEKIIRQSRNASDKEQKDRLIQKRHYLKMEHDYWKGKYIRFTMEEIKDGFKNSQAVDIGIISKYARAYLKSVFHKVYSVKGEMVAEYRKAWGLHDTFTDNFGRTQYLPKDRSNHIHHCIDAITIASMDKGKYDKLAHAWGLEDKGEYQKAKKELAKEKPWNTFTEDVRNLKNEVFIVHQNKDVLPTQTKRKFRKKGIIQKDKSGRIIYLKGDTARGSLHLGTFYGAIEKDKNGVIKKDTIDNIIPNYVVRKALTNLKKSDIVNIVDINIRLIVEQAAKDKLIIFNDTGAKIIEEGIWQNKEKLIPLKKVRIYVPSVSKNSILQDFKKHSTPFLSKKEYKQQFHVKNENNYCMAIYEGLNEKGKLKRDFELVNNIDAAEYYKLSSKSHRINYDLVPKLHSKSNLPLKYILKKGMMVLMYNETPSEVWELSNKKKINILYKIIGFEGDGRIQFRHQNTAMQQSSKNSDEKTIVKYMKDNNLKNSVINFNNPTPWLRLSINKSNILVNSFDFRINQTGKITENT